MRDVEWNVSPLLKCLRTSRNVSDTFIQKCVGHFSRHLA
jgi:hypothetical protein